MAKQNSGRAHPFDSSDPVMRTEIQLAEMYREVGEMEASNSCVASGVEKIKQGIQEAHAVLVTPRLMPRLEINIPMPAGAAIPARTPLSQPAPIPQAEPAQPAAAQSR